MRRTKEVGGGEVNEGGGQWRLCKKHDRVCERTIGIHALSLGIHAVLPTRDLFDPVEEIKIDPTVWS